MDNAQARILYAEDETSLAKETIERLERESYAVTHVTNGLEALLEIRDNHESDELKYDVLLSDNDMPSEMSGSDVILLLAKPGGPSPNLIKILYTMNPTDGLRRIMRKVGVTVLCKANDGIGDVILKIGELLKARANASAQPALLRTGSAGTVPAP